VAAFRFLASQLSAAQGACCRTCGSSRFKAQLAPNNSFKPNLLRYVNNMAERACHVVASATQVGLIQALGLIRILAMDPADNQDDPQLDPEELAAVAALSADDLGAIDRSLLAASHPSWRKVALVVGLAMDAYPDLYHDIPDVFYAERVRALVSSGQLEAQGNLHRMRFSEVRLTKCRNEA
jgi:Protein of unknown function